MRPFRQRCLKRIESMIADGTAIIFVSHDLFMVKAICESAVYLSHGTVKARGETKAIIDEYERDVHLLQTIRGGKPRIQHPRSTNTGWTSPGSRSCPPMAPMHSEARNRPR